LPPEATTIRDQIVSRDLLAGDRAGERRERIVAAGERDVGKARAELAKDRVAASQRARGGIPIVGLHRAMMT
jgi:hypothetical protein